jgi:hypothetical protein
MFAQGELLAQVNPAVTTAVTLFTASELRIEAVLLTATFVTGSTGTIDVELYHDDDGTTYNGSTIVLARRACFSKRIASVRAYLSSPAAHLACASVSPMKSIFLCTVSVNSSPSLFEGVYKWQKLMIGT